MNQGGLPGLMESDTTLPSDDGATFEGTYDPDLASGIVQKPADFPSRTYYKENVCFDVYGANCQYNYELFFHAPLYIAMRLSRNGLFAEAMKWFHYIFNPLSDAEPAAGEPPTARYWNVAPFKTTPATDLQDWFRTLVPNADPTRENAIIGEWRDHPFDPHLVASNRPLAYMKYVVIQYVKNLVAWGDSLFRRDTMETVNEALQLYVLANHVLGERPQLVPRRGTIKAESYESLKTRWDDFSNALIALENIFPYSSSTTVSVPSTGTSLLGLGPALYFCIPPNEELVEVWDTVADRLFKIRHCRNIDGVERRLGLFAPPISPAALIQAASQGLSLGNILADLSSPPPIYRFTMLIQKANEFSADVRALGTALLTTLEKKDVEELARLRASHERQMLELMTAIRERAVLEARANKRNFEKAREAAAFRLQHYVALLGNDAVTVPAAPTISATLTVDSELPPDTTIRSIEPDVDVSLVDAGERGVKLIPKEKEELDKSIAAKWTMLGAGVAATLGGIFSLFPQLKGDYTPIGVGGGAWFGGQNLGAAAQALATAARTAADFVANEAAQAATMAEYIRREQDWAFQANTAAREIVQVDKQITAADIRIQVAEKELDNHRQAIANAESIELFLRSKFTNEELYQVMKERTLAVYKQSYNLAYDMAKKVEKACRFELGTEADSIIQYGYWDNAYEGLGAGDGLQLALRQLESSYLEENRRELELTKSVSLARLNPLALVRLRETGTCNVLVPEELFDLDFRGHYFRRIKSVRLSIPCVAGPYTGVSCSLRLLNNSVRINTTLNGNGTYEHENDEGVWIDDDRFRTSVVSVTAIATSLAQNDAGMFEFNFRDERYLPFERAGAISEWQIELSTDKELRTFDYSTIADVILHLNYTAREGGGVFKEAAATQLKAFLMNTAGVARQPLAQLFSMRHEFPTEWYKFLHPAAAGADQILAFTIGKARLPFLVGRRDVVVAQIDLLAKSNAGTDYHAVLSYVNDNNQTVTSTQVTVEQNNALGGLNRVGLLTNSAGMSLDQLDIDKAMTLKLKRAAINNYRSLVMNPQPELEDVFVVFHYRLGLPV